jgi:hypothetical protein
MMTPAAAFDPGQPDEPDVLRIDRAGEGVEHPRHRRCQPVGTQRPDDLLTVHLPVDDPPNREELADALDRDDDHDQQDEQHRHGVPARRPVVQRRGHAHPGRVPDPREVSPAHERRDRGAGAQPGEDRDRRQKST